MHAWSERIKTTHLENDKAGLGLLIKQNIHAEKWMSNCGTLTKWNTTVKINTDKYLKSTISNKLQKSIYLIIYCLKSCIII